MWAKTVQKGNSSFQLLLEKLLLNTGIFQKIDHAGYERYIISRNPKRYDDYGDELEADEEDERADAEAAEENPYSEIKLEGKRLPLKTSTLACT